MAIYRLLLFRWAPLIYLVTALPATIFVAYVTPLFQMPGEETNFLHAATLLNGASGGLDAARLVVALPPRPTDSGLPIAAPASARALSWSVDAPVAAAPPQPAAGSPRPFTLPAALALRFGRALGAGLFDSAIMARLADAIVAVALGALALALAVHGRALLFVLLSLPTMVVLSGGIVSDGLMTASMALVVGLCSRSVGGGGPLGLGARLLMAVLIGAAVASRPAYCPLLLLLLTDAVRPARPHSSFVGFFIAVAPLVIALAIVATVLARTDWAIGGFPERFDMAWLTARLDAARQGVPLVWERLRTTAFGAGLDPLRGLVGGLGAGDTPIPTPFFIAWLGALGLAAVMAIYEEGQALSAVGGIVMLAIFVFAAALVFLLPPTDAMAEGARQQGRQLLPVATLLALAVPALVGARGRFAASGFGAIVSVVGWMTIFALAAISGWMMLPPVLLGQFTL